MKQWQHFWNIVFALFVFSLAACAGSNAPAQSHIKTQPTPTQPQIAPGTVLYQANWSPGLDGWNSSGGWQVVDGQLQADSLSQISITAPYRPTVANYAIEARIKVVRLLQQHGGHVDLFANQGQGKAGYQAGVGGLMGPGPRPNGSNPELQLFLDPESDGRAYVSDYDPHTEWHIYRVEVQDDYVSLVVDGTPTGSTSSTQTISNGPIGINCGMVVLQVSSFRILTL